MVPRHVSQSSTAVSTPPTSTQRERWVTPVVYFQRHAFAPTTKRANMPTLKPERETKEDTEIANEVVAFHQQRRIPDGVWWRPHFHSGLSGESSHA